jgi:acyl carrier protein
MNLDRAAIEQAIKAKIVELAEQIGEDARDLAPGELIPASGLIDSTGLLQLLAWYEHHFGIALAQEEITIDNLGSIELMASFVLRRKGLL